MSKSNKQIKWPATRGGWVFFILFVALLYALNYRSDLQGASSVDVGAERITARCVKVIDGDTLDVILDGKRERIRLLGIDCMEGYNESKQSDQARKFGLRRPEIARLSKDATAWLRQRVLKQEVELIFDPDTPRRGGYDRLLCYVEHGGVDLCLEQLKRGLAESRREPHSRKKAYDDAARTAKSSRLGIWAGK